MHLKFKWILIIFLTFLLVPQHSFLNELYFKEKNKVAIRIDDIQDFWLWNNQLLILDYLISENIKATLGIIPKNFGNDSLIVNAVNIGWNAGLFEIALHGWGDENFSKLSYEQQLELIKKGKEKLNAIFGKLELVTFIPPFNQFNEDTLKALKNQDFKVISSNLDYDPYPWEEKILKHFPQTVISAYYENGNWIPFNADSLINLLKQSLNNYGFAVLTIHPQQFSKGVDGIESSIIDRYKFEQVIKTIEWLKNNFEIVTIKELYEENTSGLINSGSINNQLNEGTLKALKKDDNHTIIIVIVIILVLLTLLAIKRRFKCFSIISK